MAGAATMAAGAGPLFVWILSRKALGQLDVSLSITLKTSSNFTWKNLYKSSGCFSHQTEFGKIWHGEIANEIQTRSCFFIHLVLVLI